MAFSPWQSGYSGNLCDKVYGFALTSWAWPHNVSLTFAHNWGKVTSVQSSLGRTLNVPEDASGATIGARSASRTSSSGVDVISDSSGMARTISYYAPVARSATQRPRPYSQLYRMLEPVAPAQPVQPALEYTYDSLGRVREARDATALQRGIRGPHQFFIAAGVRGQRLDPAGGRYTVFFDTDGNAIRHIDELNREITSTYDGRHRVTRRTYPKGDYDVFEYDTRDNVTSLVRHPDPNAVPVLAPISVSASYNSTWNKIETFTDGRSNPTTFTYHPSGNGAGLLATVVRPPVDGQQATYSFLYNSIGLVTQETDPTGRVTTHDYYPAGDRRWTKIGAAAVGSHPALNLTTNFTPNTWGDVVQSVDPRGNATTFDYDAMRRHTLTLHHNGAATAAVIAAERTNYDIVGRAGSLDRGTAFSGTNVTAWLRTATRTYTPTSKVETVTNGENELVTYAYDAMDRLEQVTDPLNRMTRYEYELAGQLTREIRAYGSPIQFDYARNTYAPNGQIESVRDANNNRSEYKYDGLGRLKRLVFPVATPGLNQSDPNNYEEYGYDSNSNRMSLRKRDGRTIIFQYDNLDREQYKDLPPAGPSTEDVYSRYDLAGRPEWRRFGSTAGMGVTYDYDAAGRLKIESSFGRAMTYGYDAASNRELVQWPDGHFISYSFDPLDRMTQVRENSTTINVGVLQTYFWDALSRRSPTTPLSRANGTYTGFAYDNASRLTGLSQDLVGLGQDVAFGFAYTDAGQLQVRTTSNNIWDPWSPSAQTRTYVPNGLNQYGSIAGITYQHDLSGNLTSDGSRSFAYDVENRLTSVSESGTPKVSLSYDPLGRLRQTIGGNATTQFLYDGDRLAAEYDNTGLLLRRYVHGASVDEPIVWYEVSGGTTNKRWLHSDERGSVIAHSESSGTATPYSYGPYGEQNSWGGSRFRYTGQIMLPEAQLYHYKARVYDPNLGRFLQTDPIGYEDDLNLYAYAGNDPINLVDPKGTAKVCAEATGSRIQSCVSVDGNGDGSTSDNDLTSPQKAQFASAYRDFILKNSGRDIGNQGTTVTGGVESERTMVRVASQFVGANLEGGWKNTAIRISNLGEGQAGRLDYVQNAEHPKGSHELLINPFFQDHRSNTSSVARTLTHEYLHRPDQLGQMFRNDDSHRALDDRAKALIKQWGLGRLGCPAVGGRTWFGLGPPAFSGCQ